MQQKSRPEEETFGTPPKSSSGGKKAMLIAAIPTVLLFLGVGLKVARVAQKAERTISHMVDHADSAVTKHSTAAKQRKRRLLQLQKQLPQMSATAFTLLVIMKLVLTYQLARI